MIEEKKRDEKRAGSSSNEYKVDTYVYALSSCLGSSVYDMVAGIIIINGGQQRVLLPYSWNSSYKTISNSSLVIN